MAKQEDIEIETEESSSILDDIYDIAHDIFPDATEKFHKKVGDLLEGAANYIENITPSWGGGLRPHLQQGDELFGWCRRKEPEGNRQGATQSHRGRDRPDLRTQSSRLSAAFHAAGFPELASGPASAYYFWFFSRLICFNCASLSPSCFSLP